MDARLAEQVANLSTRLVTEVAKLLELEETILLLKKENQSLKSTVSEWRPKIDAAERDTQNLTKLRADHAKLTELKEQAEAKSKQLEGEVEDLTASLFDEANKRVSNASRETYNFKVKNRKLHEEIEEKNTIIDSLQEQLRDLKDMFQKFEDQERLLRLNTPQPDQERSNPFDDDYGAFLSSVIHGPKARSIRFDLSLYQQEFSAFVFQLIKPDFSFDLASLKTLRFFKKMWTEEIEPTFPYVPSVSTTFINRFSKGKTFWSLIVEGKAKIEPVSGVNETFKLTYGGMKSGEERPVAMREPCAFCGEEKGDLLEHARLYTLKLYGPNPDSSASSLSTAEEDHHVIATYPLCNFCLVKLRAICELFAKLRLIHSNIYKLSQNRLFDDVNSMSNFQISRLSERGHHPHVTRRVSPEDESTIVKLYVLLLSIRAKIYWSKIGFWDTEDDVTQLNLEDVNNSVFQRIVQENVAFRPNSIQPIERPSLDGAKSNKSARPSTEAVRGSEELQRREEHEVKKEQSATTNGSEKAPAAENNKHATTENAENNSIDAKVQEEASPLNGEANAAKEAAEEPGSGDEDAFADSQDTFEAPTLSRKKSHLKQFKAKMNKDLNSTMQMLQESLEDTGN